MQHVLLQVSWLFQCNIDWCGGKGYEVMGKRPLLCPGTLMRAQPVLVATPPSVLHPPHSLRPTDSTSRTFAGTIELQHGQQHDKDANVLSQVALGLHQYY